MGPETPRGEPALRGRILSLAFVDTSGAKDRAARRDRRRRDLGSLGRPNGRSDPGRGRSSSPRAVGPGRVDRSGRPARGDRTARFTENLVIGLGGQLTIHRSHFLGRSATWRRSWATRTVPSATWSTPGSTGSWRRGSGALGSDGDEDTPEGVVHRGVFVGHGRSGESGGAAYNAAAELRPLQHRGRLDTSRPRDLLARPRPVHDDLGRDKAVYFTRMALADGGDLVVLTPGVFRSGEDAAVGALIRRHGYAAPQPLSPPSSAIPSSPRTSASLRTHPRQQRGSLPHRLLHRPRDRWPHPRGGRGRRLRLALPPCRARSARRHERHGDRPTGGS